MGDEKRGDRKIKFVCVCVLCISVYLSYPPFSHPPFSVLPNICIYIYIIHYVLLVHIFVSRILLLLSNSISGRPPFFKFMFSYLKVNTYVVFSCRYYHFIVSLCFVSCRYFVVDQGAHLARVAHQRHLTVGELLHDRLNSRFRYVLVCIVYLSYLTTSSPFLVFLLTLISVCSP